MSKDNLTLVHSTSTPTLGQLLDKLAPSSDETATAIVEQLSEFGFRFPSHMSPSGAVERYIDTFKSFPVGAAETFLEKALNGKYEFCATGFLPIPPGIAALLTSEEDRVKTWIKNIKEGDRRRMIVANSLPFGMSIADREREIDRIMLAIENGADPAKMIGLK